MTMTSGQLKRKQLHRQKVVRPARARKRAQADQKPVPPRFAYEPGYAAFLRRVEDVTVGCECDIAELLALGD